MMIGAFSHQRSYNTVLNDKRNVVLVLIYNVDLVQHSNHCKKSFLIYLTNDDRGAQPSTFI